MEPPTAVVIGRVPCQTSQGSLAIGDRQRLPVLEAILLAEQQQVTLADWQEQQAAAPRARRRYRRRDLRAEA